MKQSSNVAVCSAQILPQASTLVAVLLILVLPTCTFPQCTYTTLEDGEMYDVLGAQQDDEYFYQIVQPSNYWCAVAVRSEWRTVDPDLLLYPEWAGVPPCIGGDLLCECSLPSGQVDFIALDYTQLTPGTDYYAMVTIDTGSGDCHVQWEDGGFELTGMNVFQLYFGPTSFIVRVINVYLIEGTTYRFTFDCEGTEVRMCLFYGGVGAMGSRADAEFEVGCGQPYAEYTAPASQMYGLVFFNEGGSGGMFSIGPVVDTLVESRSWGLVKALYH